MRKQRELTIPRIHPNALAAQLKRGCGKEKALKIADGLVKELKVIGPEDVNPDFFRLKDIRRNERIWTQVGHILRNQKGYTAFELLFFLAVVSIVVLAICVVALEFGVIVHFVRKFW